LLDDTIISTAKSKRYNEDDPTISSFILGSKWKYFILSAR
jgi:hypothetical protein